MSATITPFRRGTSSGDDTPQVQRIVERPVAVLSSFIVSPNARTGWVNLWSGIATQASTWPGCRSFQVLSDRNDDMYCAVMSEWDNLEAYNSFSHDSRLGWVMQTMKQISIPGERRFLDLSAGASTDERTGTDP